MSDNRTTGGAFASGGQRSDTICIDTYRVLDSCRDRDCYEDVRVYLDAAGQNLIDNTSTIRVVDAKIVNVFIGIDEVPFNDGFFQLDLRYFLLIRCEACNAGRSQTFYGIGRIDKKVVLWGGEGNVSIFKSDGEGDFCHGKTEITNNLPICVVETVPPIVLSDKIVSCDCHCGCCNVGTAEFPEYMTALLDDGPIDPERGNRLYISLGIFSVIRIERPAQYLIAASDYSVPE